MARAAVVLVSGVLGWGTSSDYWSQATSSSTNTHGLRIVEANVGPVSSHHDRACELFAQIKGCVVDYGSVHATECDHQRYGRDFTNSALFAKWGEDRPVHLVCHSSGILTARVLQNLLANDYWSIGTNSRWVRSIVSIAGNINGTTLPYLFGVDEATGNATREKWLEMYSRLRHAVRWVSKKKKAESDERAQILDWNLEHWGVSSCDENIEENIEESKLLTNNDHLLYQTSLHGTRELNETLSDYEGTYYFSFIALSTNLKNSSPINWSTNPLFMMPSGYMLHKKFEQAPIPDFVDNTDWNENDGFVPLAAQVYPFRSECGGTFQPKENYRTGVWYSTRIQSLLDTELTWDHIDACWGLNFLKPVRLQHNAESQARLYETIFETLSDLS